MIDKDLNKLIDSLDMEEEVYRVRLKDLSHLVQSVWPLSIRWVM